MKKLLIIGLILLLKLSTQAQESRHYLYLNGGGGSQNLNYSLLNGDVKNSFNATLNIGYGYFINKHWGLLTGIGLQSFKPSASLNYRTGVPAVDTDGDSYEFRTYYNNWQEEQKLIFFDLPVEMQYRHLLSKKLTIFAAAGLKMSVPVMSSYKTTGGEIATTGYYSQWNVELKNLPQYGFKNITDLQSGDFTVKTSWSGIADMGLSYAVSEKIDLYAGGYLSYGLNNISKSTGKLVFQKDNVYNGVLASDQIGDLKTSTVGFKVGVLWHFGKRKEIIRPVVEEKIVPKTSVPEKHVVEEKKAEAKEPIKISNEETQSDAKRIVKVEENPIDKAYATARAIADSIKIYFRFNAVHPKSVDIKRVKDLSNIVIANPDMQIRIVGHTDNLGSPEVNKVIGLLRADNVKRLFTRNGVKEAQVKTEQKLADKALPSNDSKKNRSISRIITLFIE